MLQENKIVKNFILNCADLSFLLLVAAVGFEPTPQTCLFFYWWRLVAGPTQRPAARTTRCRPDHATSFPDDNFATKNKSTAGGERRRAAARRGGRI